jgi:hypothetical protein
MQVDGLTEPLWDASSVPYQYTDNSMFVRDYTIKLLGTSFPNMITAEVRMQLQEFGCVFDHHKSLTSFLAQVTKFVDGLLSSKHDLPSFKNHIRDFLVQSKEFSAQVTCSISLWRILCVLLCFQITWCQLSCNENTFAVAAFRITRIYMLKRLLSKENGNGNGCLPSRGSLPLVNCKMRW